MPAGSDFGCEDSLGAYTVDGVVSGLHTHTHDATMAHQTSNGHGLLHGGGRRGASVQQKQSKMRFSVQKKRLEIAMDLGLSCCHTYTVIDRESKE